MYSNAAANRHTLPQGPLGRARVAVVLNGNARGVSTKVIGDLRHLLQDDPSRLYVSQSLDQGVFIARHIVNKGFDVVLCGGGDGTFCQVVTDILALRPARTPAFGVLRLGTGNALATTLGASPPTRRGLEMDLLRAQLSSSRRDLPVLRVEGRLTPFAGVGLDSQILADYNDTKKLLAGTPLSNLGQGGMGYALAVATRSLWRFVLEPLPEVTVRNDGEPAWRVDLHGRPMGEPVPRGGVLYRGPVALAAASTIPYYGLGLRLFPQAEMRRDRFQLRVGNVDALSVLTQLPSIFRGTFSDPRICDFHCTAVTIHAATATPFQVAGDEVGRRTTIHVRMTHIQAVAAGPGHGASEGLQQRAA
jgi:diacylglycerol kinase family enzyme